MGDEFSEDMEYDVPEETFEAEVPEIEEEEIPEEEEILEEGGNSGRRGDSGR